MSFGPQLFGADAINAMAQGADDGVREVFSHWTEPGEDDGKLNVWSTCKIDGKWFPGVGDLKDAGACIAIPKATRSLVTDKLRSLGKNNTRQIHHGYAAAEIDIEVRMWTPAQWQAFKAYLPQIDPARKVKRTITSRKQVQGAPNLRTSVTLTGSGREVASTTTIPSVLPAPTTVTTTSEVEEIPSHTIEHPDLSMLNISQIYITSISTPDDVEDGGVRTIRIRGIEVVKPPTGNKVVSKGISTSTQLNNDSDVLPEFKLNTGPTG